MKVLEVSELDPRLQLFLSRKRRDTLGALLWLGWYVARKKIFYHSQN